MSGEFKQHGPSLLRNGYLIVPLPHGSKGPRTPGWQHARYAPQDTQRFNGEGVGVMTGQGDVPLVAVDIDCMDGALAARFKAWCVQHLGATVERVGRAPKTMLIYRAAAAGWPKAQSSAWSDFLGGKNQLEVLGAGQQFVAYHTHPDTGQPYRWLDVLGGIVAQAAHTLPVVTPEQINAALAEFDRLMREAGCVHAGGAAALAPVAVARDSVAVARDSVALLANLKEPLMGWPLERVRAELLPWLPNKDVDYETWLQVVMALHHQGEGAQEWLDLALEWSATSDKHVPETLEYKWQSFSEQRAAGRGAVTLATLVKRADDVKAAFAAHQFKGLLDAIDQAASVDELKGPVALAVRRVPGLDGLQFEQLVTTWGRRFKALTQTRAPVADVRALLRQPSVARAGSTAPEWAAEWVICGSEFLNLRTKMLMDTKSWDMAFDREMQPDPSTGLVPSATRMATTTWQLPVVARMLYMPNAAPVFDMDGVRYANLYRADSVPVTPERVEGAGAVAVGRWLAHFELLLPDQRERELLISWLAWCVQHPGDKITWAPFLSGAEGAGKSFIKRLLMAVLGQFNVKPLSGSTIAAGPFTDWAISTAVTVIEEIKLHGHNRFDIMNRIKPFVTDDMVEIHPKGKATYSAPNTTNYMVFSNFLDGLPITKGDRRYLILQVALSTERAEELTIDGYFDRLDETFAEAGSLRRWLLDWKMHPEFRAKGRAPGTVVRGKLVELSRSDDDLLIEDVLEVGGQGVGRDVLSSAHLGRLIEGKGRGKLHTSRLSSVLSSLGWEPYGRVKWSGEACRVWTRKSAPMMNSDEIRAALDTAGAKADFL